MLPGPKLQQGVFDVLLCFRSNSVAMIAVLTEMFSQVIMAKKDGRYQRFQWRGLDIAQTPDVYEAMRLISGDRASSYGSCCTAARRRQQRGLAASRRYHTFTDAHG